MIWINQEKEIFIRRWADVKTGEELLVFRSEEDDDDDDGGDVVIIRQ
ncbi:MAG: hypothetical protein CM15mL4_0620 [uncultured marine virus]|nr:MAG: hypothetical protein CM15mL4_0620 [uncultured marine virus]